LHVQPTLKEMSVQALEILDCNEQGFVAVSSNFNVANSE
jgi:alkaline phosphatase